MTPKTASEVAEGIFADVLKLLERKQGEYGDAWKASGKEVCINEVFRKANYVRVQWQHGLYTTAKFREDLLDLLGWGALACSLIDEEANNATGS